MSPNFKPTHIYVDQSVEALPHTKRILAKFPNVPTDFLDDAKILKKPKEMTWAKKGLILTRYKADLPLKPFGAMTESAGRPNYTLSLISNCHLECTYCILQSFLSNNPVITIYTNIEEILSKLDKQLYTLPKDSFIGTGKIADSLALEELTEYHRTLIPFFAQHTSDIELELKTKSDQVEQILDLEHNNKTIISWSMNPAKIVSREELKTASLKERLQAAQKCAQAGYRVGFHIDPMIYHDHWQKNYNELIEQIVEALPHQKIAWFSFGILRYPSKQKKLMQKRFPKNQQIHEEMKHTHLPFLTYSENLRRKMYRCVQTHLKKLAPKIPHYLTMETQIDLTQLAVA